MQQGNKAFWSNWFTSVVYISKPNESKNTVSNIEMVRNTWGFLVLFWSGAGRQFLEI